MYNFRGKFPFRLGGTSWITHGTLEENLKELSRHVDDMEIVLFSVPGASNIPSPEEVNRLAQLTEELGMSCSVHFPVDVCNSLNPEDRKRAEDSCFFTAELLAPLRPFAWVLHLVGTYFIPTDDPKWLDLSHRFVARLVEKTGDSRRLCVESLDYPFECVAPIVEDLDLSVCMDVGHMICGGYDLEGYLDRWLDRSRMIHLHAVRPDGVDHSSLAWMQDDQLQHLLDRFAQAEGERVVTIEVFEGDFNSSLPSLERVLTKGCGQSRLQEQGGL